MDTMVHMDLLKISSPVPHGMLQHASIFCLDAQACLGRYEPISGTSSSWVREWGGIPVTVLTCCKIIEASEFGFQKIMYNLF